MKRSLLDFRAGDEEKLRTLKFDILPTDKGPSDNGSGASPAIELPPPTPATPPAHGDRQSLLLRFQTHEGSFFPCS